MAKNGKNWQILLALCEQNAGHPAAAGGGEFP
jgi:hypothetical protein